MERSRTNVTEEGEEISDERTSVPIRYAEKEEKGDEKWQQVSSVWRSDKEATTWTLLTMAYVLSISLDHRYGI